MAFTNEAAETRNIKVAITKSSPITTNPTLNAVEDRRFDIRSFSVNGAELVEISCAEFGRSSSLNNGYSAHILHSFFGCEQGVYTNTCFFKNPSRICSETENELFYFHIDNKKKPPRNPWTAPTHR